MDGVNSAIYSRLSGGTALVSMLGGTAIYHEAAPDGAALPYVVYSQVSGVINNDSANMVRYPSYFVRGYSTSNITAHQIDAACEALLHHATLTVSGWTNIHTLKDEDISNTEILGNNSRVYMAGGYYTIQLA